MWRIASSIWAPDAINQLVALHCLPIDAPRLCSSSRARAVSHHPERNVKTPSSNHFLADLVVFDYKVFVALEDEICRYQ